MNANAMNKFTLTLQKALKPDPVGALKKPCSLPTEASAQAGGTF
jgi:hypothetical protein